MSILRLSSTPADVCLYLFVYKHVHIPFVNSELAQSMCSLICVYKYKYKYIYIYIYSMNIVKRIVLPCFCHSVVNAGALQTHDNG